MAPSNNPKETALRDAFRSRDPLGTGVCVVPEYELSLYYTNGKVSRLERMTSRRFIRLASQRRLAGAGRVSSMKRIEKRVNWISMHSLHHSILEVLESTNRS